MNFDPITEGQTEGQTKGQTKGQTEDQTEDRTEDRNNFSIEGMKDGVKQWTQGVSDSLQNIIHRVSTSGRLADGEIRFRPFGGALPKPDLVGPLIGVP